jgi:hypothetical protein
MKRNIQIIIKNFLSTKRTYNTSGTQFKRKKLWIIGIKAGEGVQAKGIENVFN